MSPNLKIIRRPDDGGSEGRKIKVDINVYCIKSLTTKTGYQYDVVMTPEIPPQKARQAWRQVELQLSEGNHNQQSLFAYDGRSIAFSATKIDPVTLDVYIHKNVEIDLSKLKITQMSRGGRPSSVRFTAPPMRWLPVEPIFRTDDANMTERISVKIKQSAQVSFKELLDFAMGREGDENRVLHSTMCLSLLLRHIPATLFTPVASNFFSPDFRVPIFGGVEVWRGYHQSIAALMAGHLGINIDVASTVFRKGGISAIEYIKEVTGARSDRDLDGMSQRKISDAIKNVTVITNHRGDRKIRFKVVRIGTESARSKTFTDSEGATKTIEEYFFDQYQIKLRYPKLPLALKANGKTAFPLELLHIVPGQRFMKRLNSSQTSDMIRATVQNPVDRKKSIEDGVLTTLNYMDNPYLKSFELDIDDQMMQVNARVLKAPNVQFLRRSLSGQTGAWNLRDVKLVDAPKLESFAFLFFAEIDSRSARDIMKEIIRKWRVAGMNIVPDEVPVNVVNPERPGNIRGALSHAFNKAQEVCKKRCQLLVCMIDKNEKDVYQMVKQVTLAEAGVVSQCMLFKHVRSARDIKDQYIANVALKANVKIGGATNHVLDLGLPGGLNMIIGADVTHTNPGSGAPSVAAVVCSVDEQVTKYHTYVRGQGHRVEIIQDMFGIMVEALKNFKQENNDEGPKRILFFRDGVAAGQFAEVMISEVDAVHKALKSLNMEHTKLTFMIVQKRHHYRLFPADKRDQDKSGNCLPGTVVDTSVMHPTQFNFFLQSHAGLQGMSRPSLYHVLLDENMMTSDQVQKICFNLCFLSQRATRSIDARMFLEGDDSSETGSCTGSAGALPNINLRKLAQGMEKTSYYM